MSDVNRGELRVYKILYSIRETVSMGRPFAARIASVPAGGAARGRARELQRVQFGEEPTDWRPMTDIGAGVCEIRIHGAVDHRVLYVARFPEAVYVLHAFEKKSRTTPRPNLTVARLRFRTLASLREGRRQ